MQPDQALGARQLFGQRLEFEAGGVGRQQCRVLHARLQRRIQRALGVQALENGLDDHIGVGDTLAGYIGAQPRACLGDLVGLPQALLEQLGRTLECRLDEFQRPVLQRDIEAAQRAPGRDVTAHDAGANDMDGFDIRGGLWCFGP